MEPVHLSLTIQHCEYTYVKEVTKAILHTILFHRQFGQIAPKQQELLDLTLSSIDDVDIEHTVDERTNEYIKSLHESGVSTTTATSMAKPSSIMIDFYEKRTRKIWFTTTEEEVLWESWTIKYELIPTSRSEQERKRNLKALGSQLEDAIFKIITIVNERNEAYLPPIPHGESKMFPYQIIVR